MPRPVSHEIDEKAKRLFQASLPSSWLIREQHPDYHVDYVIEPFDKGESTGQFFCVQLKGTQSPRFVDESRFVSFSLKTDHVAYFADTVPLPVFLVVVDVSSDVAWWLDLQSFAKLDLKNREWRSKGTTTVRLPVSNALKNADELSAAVDDAHRRLREWRPSSVQAALQAERQRWESLDGRVSVDLRASEGLTEIEISPNAPMEFQFSISGKEAQRKLDRLVESGEVVEFDEGELTAAGSPLLQNDEYELYALRFGKELQAELRLTVKPHENEPEAVLTLRGTFTGGTKRGVIDVHLPDAPLSMKIPLDYTSGNYRPDVQFDASKWSGQELRLLSHVEPLNRFLRALIKLPTESYINLDVDLQGNPVVSGVANRDFGLLLLDHSESVFFMHKARYVALKLGLRVIVPQKIESSHYVEIETLYSLLKNGRFTHPSPNATYNLSIGTEGLAGLLECTKGSGPKTGRPFSYSQYMPFPFLGMLVDIGPVRVEMTSLYLSTKRQAIRQAIAADAPNPMNVTLSVAADCVYTATRISNVENPHSDRLSTDADSAT